MSIDALITQAIEILKADKSIPAEYRNSVISTGRRWQCEIRGAKTMTVLKPENGPAGSETYQQTNFAPNAAIGTVSQATGPICTCPAGGRRRDCLIHGLQP